MICRVARLPIAVECAASSMLRPHYAPALPRPVAVVEGHAKGAIRFLPVAKSVLFIGAGGVRAAILTANAVEPIESLFAYPMGILRTSALDWKSIDADPEVVRDRWACRARRRNRGRAERRPRRGRCPCAGAAPVRRPLGSFQAIQHRLAGAAAKIEAAYWLTLRAAQGLNAGDAATALGYVQEASTKVVYDLHQFMGAMGLTLEHPLHRWTYRARLLRSSLGGAGANLQTVSAQRWRQA